MLGKRGRVPLSLLQDALHDRVGNNGDDLWILLYPLHGLLLGLTLARRVHRLHGLPGEVLDFSGVFVLRVRFCCRVARLEALVVLAHGEAGLGFSDVSAHEARVALDGFVAILDSFREGHEFCEGRCAVGVPAWVPWCTFDHLRVGLYSLGPVCRLEVGIPSFSCLFGFFWVDVGDAIAVCLDFLDRTKLLEDFGGAVFREGSLVVVYCCGVVFKFLVGGTDTTEGSELPAFVSLD